MYQGNWVSLKYKYYTKYNHNGQIHFILLKIQ